MTTLAAERERSARPAPAAAAAAWPFACPTCLHSLRLERDALHCPGHGPFPRADGVWRLLASDRAARYEQFLREYQAVRRAEGRGGVDAAYYRALPFVDRADPLADQWRIRAGSWRALVARALDPMERALGRPLHVLDLGAGNGWLSHRVARRGHWVAALDLGDDARDGLGAHAWYGPPAPFTPVQADFDRIPLADRAADLVVFNASLHYSTDIAVTLGEAQRVLKPDGRIVVLDSPVYRSAESGRRMVEEREALFERRYGFPSNALASENYFTVERLDEAAAGLGLRWRSHVPWHGVRWALRPWIARARSRREPSSFLLLIGSPTAGEADAPAPRRREGIRAAARRAALRARYRVMERPREGQPVWETVAGLRLLVLPGVFNPRIFRTGKWLARFVGEGVVRPGAAVLDLGTGSGAVALAAAGRAGRVVAVDLNPTAVRCAQDNARRNGLADRIDVREGDLFGALREDERFDLVTFNPPFYRGAPRDATDLAWRSVDVPERFAAGLTAHLAPGARALVLLSSDCDVEGWLRPSREAGLAVRRVAEEDLGNETLLLYRIAPRAAPGTGGRAR